MASLASEYMSWVEATASSTAAAWLTSNDEASVRLTLRRSHRDIINNKPRSTLQHVILPLNTPVSPSAALPPQNDCSGVSVMSFSPSGRFFFTMRKESPVGATTGRTVLEVFAAEHCCAPLATIHIDARVHGDVNTDAAFGVAPSTCAWSHDERYIVYVAESRAAETASHFDDLIATSLYSGSPPDASSVGGGKLVGSQFDFNAPGGAAGATTPRETWGERYDAVRTPRMYVCDLETQRVVMVSDVPGEVSVGRPQWMPGTPESPYILAYTAYAHSPRRMGITYCTHRESAIMCVDVTPQLQSASASLLHVPVTPSHLCARSPRLCGATLVYLCTPSPVGDRVHAYRSDVYALPWHAVLARVTGQPDAPPLRPLLLDTTSHVRVRSRASGGDAPGPFYGAYTSELADVVGDCVFFNCVMGARAAPVCMRVLDGAIDLILEDVGVSPGWDATLLCARAAPTEEHPRACVLAVVTSSPTSPERVAVLMCHDPAASGGCVQLWAAPLNAADCTASITSSAPRWLLPHARVRDALALLRLARFPVACTHPDGVCEVLLLYSRGASQARVCIVPHGGPHASFSHAYMHSYAFMASRGYAVALINYSGSYGYGDAAMNACVGSIGVNDVWECVEATRAALAVCGAPQLMDAEQPGMWASHYAAHAVADATVDPSRVYVCGGSHGGFLTMHLVIGRPDLFAAASLRNPVCDVVAMHAMTDIPDWCVAESLGAAAWDRSVHRHTPLLRSDMLSRMAAVSPAHAPGLANVRAAVQIAVGLKDRRVVPYDGIHMHHVLTAAGVPTRLLVYPEDNHALDKPATEADFWMNTLAWFDQHERVRPAASV